MYTYGSCYRDQDRHAGERYVAGLGGLQPERHHAVIAHVGEFRFRGERDEILGVLLRVVVKVDVSLPRQGRAAHEPRDRREQCHSHRRLLRTGSRPR